MLIISITFALTVVAVDEICDIQEIVHQSQVSNTMAGKAKQISKVLPPPRSHWVGDGFHVKPVFANMAFTKMVSPFLMFDYAPPEHFPATSKKLGVGQHPHRGFETVTIAFNGEVEHGDSRGNRDVIGEGDVQWMTAASGIIHEEFHSRTFAAKGGLFSMAQIWVNLPKKDKMGEPGYQAITKSKIPKANVGAGCVARVIAGECNGIRGPARTHTALNLWEVLLKVGAKIDLPVPDGHNTILFVRSGGLKVGGKKPTVLRESQVSLWSIDGAHIPSIEATVEGTSLLLLSGVPIDEPIAARGPFVMNTKMELDAASRDYRSGKFGNHF